MSNGSTDSYDSSAGTYGTTACSTVAPTYGSTCVGGIATNGTTTGALDLGPGADVNGGCTVGSGGTTTNGISCQSSQEPTCSASGPCNGGSVLSTPVVLSSVTAPTWPAGTTPSSLAATITPNKSYSAMSFGGSASNILTLNGTGDYVMNGLTLSGNASLALAAGTTAVIYMTANFDIGGNGISNPGGKPTDLIIMCSDAVTDAKINGNGSGAFGLYCPKADIKITGNGEVFGAVVGKTVSFSGSNGKIHYDKALASSTSGAISCATNEVSRAQPIISSVTCTSAGDCGSAAVNTYESIFQGTFEQTTTTVTTLTTTASVATFAFPWIKGHMRARDTASVGTAGSTYSTGTVLFDAGASGKIPARTLAGCSTYIGSCRHVFTNTNTTATTGTTRYPTITHWDTGTASILGPLIASTTDVPGITNAHYQTIITTILNGALGGVDRSTVAVIEASALANASTRPKMAYFGGTDGMLHAVCAEKGGTTPTGSNICPSHGTELWAFLPRAQMGLIKTNTSRVDGSVHVVDAFADFANPQVGKKSWRTILTFQTGYHKTGTGSFPAAYALDVTDPANPKLIWEYTTPTSPGSLDFGTGSDVAVGPTLSGAERIEQAFLETNNGGSGGSGVVAVGVDLAKGTRSWIFDQGLYPAADGVPATGIPGGAVPVDLNETGYISDVLFADLYGRIWRVSSTTGVSVTGVSTPLFKFSALFKPIGGSPALWRITSGGALYVAFASGGFMDQNNTAWMSGNQYIVVAKVKPTGSTFPLTEASPSLSGNVRIAEVLSAGYGSFSSPVIVGDQIFVTADVGNINSSTYGAGTTTTGKVFTVDLQGVAATTSVVIAGGASALAQGGTSTTLYASGNGKQTQLATAATSTSGQSVDSTAFSRTSRNLWLRTE